MSSLLNYSAKTDVVRKSSNIYPFTLLTFTKSQLCTGHRDTAAGGNPCYMLIAGWPWKRPCLWGPVSSITEGGHAAPLRILLAPEEHCMTLQVLTWKW